MVTECCGGHRPAEGEASTCPCCAECITNVDVQRRTPAERAEMARADREALAWRRARIVSAQRWARREFAHRYFAAMLADLDAALHHAVEIPEQPQWPATDEDASVPSRWFRKAAS